MRLAAALAIQKIGPANDVFVPVLVGALRAGEGGIFLEVEKMEGHAKWTVPTLNRLLSHPETKIRALTSRVLGQLGPTASDAESALNRTLRDPEEVVRKAARQAMEQITSKPVTGR